MNKPPGVIDFPALGLSGAEALESVLLKAMSILPQDRYQSVAEFKGALEAILTGILSHTDFRAARAGVGETQTEHAVPTQVARPGPTAATAVARPAAPPRSWLSLSLR